MKVEAEIEWKETDGSNEQFGRQLSATVFEFKETNKAFEISHDADKVIQMKIDLSTYTYAQIMEHCAPYYKTMAELFATYGADSEWIIAECIFEQESGQY